MNKLSSLEWIHTKQLHTYTLTDLGSLIPHTPEGLFSSQFFTAERLTKATAIKYYFSHRICFCNSWSWIWHKMCRVNIVHEVFISYNFQRAFCILLDTLKIKLEQKENLVLNKTQKWRFFVIFANYFYEIMKIKTELSAMVKLKTFMKKICFRINFICTYMLIQIIFNHWTLWEYIIHTTYKCYLFEHYDNTRGEKNSFWKEGRSFGIMVNMDFLFLVFTPHNVISG